MSLLPVVAPMVGSHPVWMVDGSANEWGDDRPVKTLWVVARDVPGSLRVTGHRLDAADVLSFQDGYQRPRTRELVFEDPRRTSVTPGGASPDVMRAYAFLPSYVIYPSAGCWEFNAQLGSTQVRFTIDITSPHRALFDRLQR